MNHTFSFSLAPPFIAFSFSLSPAAPAPVASSLFYYYSFFFVATFVVFFAFPLWVCASLALTHSNTRKHTRTHGCDYCCCSSLFNFVCHTHTHTRTQWHAEKSRIHKRRQNYSRNPPATQQTRPNNLSAIGELRAPSFAASLMNGNSSCRFDTSLVITNPMRKFPIPRNTSANYQIVGITWALDLK